MDKIISVYKSVIQKCSIPVSGCILNNSDQNVVVKSSWSQRNIERKAHVRSELTQIVNFNPLDVNTLTSTDISSELLTSYSPSGKFRALFREIPASGKSLKKQHLEIWNKNLLWKLFDLTSYDLHGDVNTDSEFSCFQWSPCETKILYVAEKKVPKAEPFLPMKPSSKNDEETKKGSEYELVEEWGEQLVGKSSPVLCICDLEQELISVVTGCPEDHSLGQAIWAPDGGIVATAWSSLPWRLGLIFCTNRQSWIVHISPDGKCSKLSEDGLAVRSPKFSPDMSSLVWLERQVGGPHHACHRLVCYDWTSEKSSVVVDIVEDSVTTADGQQFYGIYSENLPVRCWLPDNKTVILNTVQRASLKPYLVDTVSKDIHAMSEDNDDNFNMGLLDINKDLVLCYRSSLDTPPSLLLGRMASKTAIEWQTLLEQEPIVNGFRTGVLRLDADKEDNCVNKFSALYMVPKDVKDAPLVLWSHGGPHAVFTNGFSLFANFLGSLGFGMVLPNYRGSVGAGQLSVDFLLGKVGSSDVRDSQAAAETVLKMFSDQLSPNKCLLFGGSHGGFLSLHLAAQYPSSYKSCVALNPVVDLTTFPGSDIPDWALVEAGYKFEPTIQMTPQKFEQMMLQSPISNISSVTAPVLLLLGKKDLRVPAYQGFSYYHQLRARGIKSRVLVYDDNHSLSQVPHQVDLEINSVLWFMEAIDHPLE